MNVFAAYLNHRCVGVCRKNDDKEKTKTVPAEVLITEIINKMGYDSYNEYLEYLPGHEPGEKLDIVASGFGFEGDGDGDYECVFGEDFQKIKHPLTFRFEMPGDDEKSGFVTKLVSPGSLKIGFAFPLEQLLDPDRNDNENCMFLIQPDMKTVLDACDSSNTPNYDKLWYCEDWVEKA